MIINKNHKDQWLNMTISFYFAGDEFIKDSSQEQEDQQSHEVYSVSKHLISIPNEFHAKILRLIEKGYSYLTEVT